MDKSGHRMVCKAYRHQGIYFSTYPLVSLKDIHSDENSQNFPKETERTGSGVGNMIALYRSAGLRDPELSLDDALKLDRVRETLKSGDVVAASKYARKVYALSTVAA